MKTTRFFLCAGISLLLCGIANAQIQVEQDGGIKIGTKPVVMGVSRWGLSSKGLEVNVGEVRFCASNGATLRFSEYVSSTKGAANPGDGFIGDIDISVQPNKFSQLTGVGLKVGTDQSRVWEVNTYNFSSLDGTSSVSDRRMKRNIMPIGESRQLVMALRPVTYDFIVPEDYLGDTASLQNKAGFIAQEVLEVLPGAVGYNEETDLYSLKYSYFIPYLTKTIQEQDEEILNLKEEVSNLKEQLRASEERLERIEAMLEATLGIGNAEEGDAPGIMSTGNNHGNGNMGNANGTTESHSQTDATPFEQNGESNGEFRGAKLWQNMPNPTNGNTVIRYELPANCKGKIVFTSGNGQTVKVYNLPMHAGIGEIEVYGQSFNAGVYSYSLVVNGRSVDTKRMVLNK